MQILDGEAMVKLISKRSNLSAPGLEGIAFPFFKLEIELAAGMILSMMHFSIFYKKYPTIGKY
jgi:hypothetical protein